jgi:glycosyltransferase involved in cell wall biosynthesis
MPGVFGMGELSAAAAGGKLSALPNMESPIPDLVSVALCTFNGGRFLDRQISSLLEQRGVALEVIACDDGSTDDTWALLQAWAAKDGRIRVFRNTQRLGFTDNFVHAMSLCRGEYIAPCDQDDIWMPNKLSRLVAHMGEHLLCYCDSALIDDEGNSLGQRISDRINMFHGCGVVPLAFWNSVSGHALVFRASLLRRAWPFPQGSFFDWWLAAVAASHGSVGYVDEALVAYRQHGQSQTDVAQRRSHAHDSWGRFRSRELWLRHLASLPGPDQAYCARLSELWSARERQWWSPALCLHLAARSADVMRLNKRESFGRFVLKQFFGQRWRPERLENQG